MGVPQTHGIGIVTVGALEREETEVAASILGDAVVLVGDLVPVVAERIFDHIDELAMRQRNMAGRCRRGLKRAKAVVVGLHCPSMQYERHGYLLDCVGCGRMLCR